MMPNFSKQTISEMIRLLNLPDDLEHGFALYNKNNKIVCGKEAIGTKYSVGYDDFISNKVLGTFHTHVLGRCCVPSYGDFINNMMWSSKSEIICIGFKIPKRIICFERKIYRKYIKKFTDRWFYDIIDLEYILKNKYMFKNLDLDSFNFEVSKDPIWFEREIVWAKNTSDLHYKYEIDTKTYEVKKIGYKMKYS